MIRNAKIEDLENIRNFVKSTPPLGFHTLYTYWILVSQFNELFFIYEENNQIKGFICGVKNLSKESTALVWQIGVSESMRGTGVSKSLISAFIEKCSELKIQNGIVTINPNNISSLNFFKNYFTKYSNFEPIDSLDIIDQYSSEHEYEDVYQFKI